MTVTIKHAKTNNVPDWTQTDLDTVIAGGAPPAPAPGTLLADITQPSDWNADHTIDTTGASNGDVLTVVAGVAEWAAPTTSSASWGSITGTLSSQTDLQAALDSKRSYTRVTAGDTNTTIASSARVAATSAAFTAPRTWTLPAASAVPAGEEVIVTDSFGGVTSTNTLTVQRAGSDTINGATSVVIGAAYAMRRFVSNGSNAWTFDAGVLRASNNLSDVANAGTARTNLSVGQASGWAKLTVGTSAPASPATGDLWVDTSA